MYRLPYFKLLAQTSGTTTLKKRYDADRREHRIRTLRRLSVLATLFYFSYIPVDMYLLPDMGLRSVMLRLFVVGPLAVFTFYYFERPGPIRHKELASIITVSLATLIWCLGLLGTSDPRVLHYFYAGLVFQLSLTIVLAHPFEYSVYASIFVCLCFYTIIWFLPGANIEYVTNHLVVGVPTVVLTLMANYRFSAESLRLYQRRIDAEELRVELARRNTILDNLSHSDPLTRLANRRGLSRHVARLVQNQREAERHAVVILIDVDHFKAFNDAYGHDVGDECLEKIAGAIEGACDPQAIACRYGGEEFLVLQTAHASDAEARGVLLAERIRRAVGELGITHPKAEDGHVTVSLGVSAGRLDRDEALTPLIKAADQALYAAKKAGHNRVSEVPK